MLKNIAACLVALFLMNNALYAAIPAITQAEPAPNAINLNLPIHQQKKLHPELSDPVLGDQAQIVEWAWSPQYAKRFGVDVQQDGLPNGGLWLIGIKIQRQQNKEWQRYTCNIVGGWIINYLF